MCFELKILFVKKTFMRTAIYIDTFVYKDCFVYLNVIFWDVNSLN